MRGPQVSGEYLDTEPSVDGAGWLVTGDVGLLDGSGYLYVEGRADDVIIRGGENLSPTEIEDTLLRHDAVQAVAIVGIPDPEWGESVAAAVVLAPVGQPAPDGLGDQPGRMGAAPPRVPQDPRTDRGGRRTPHHRHRQGPAPRGA